MLLNLIKKIFMGELSKEVLLSEIKQLQIEVTNRCNLKCSICWRSVRDNDCLEQDISFERFKKIFDNLLQYFTISMVNTQGLGEPLINSDIFRVLAYIKSKNIAVWFVTNGLLLDDEKARRLVEIGIDKLRVSIDSADAMKYEKIKIGSDLATVIKNIQWLNFYKIKLKKSSPLIAFNTVVTRNTIDGLRELIDLAVECKVSEISLIPLVSFGKGEAIGDNQVDFYSKSFQERFEFLKKIANEKNIDLNLGISMESKEKKFCHTALYINVSGAVYPCCNITNYSLGNILQENIAKVKQRYLQLRKLVDKQNLLCKECNSILDK